MGAALARQSAEAAPARAPEPGRAHDRRRVQTALKLSDPGDAAEREAVSTARAVMRMPDPVLSPRARVPLLAARAPAPAAPKAKKDEVSAELTAEIKSQVGGGRPLSSETRSFLEPRFKANFAGVRVHTGGKAENLATRLGARAFTYGKDIFFNAGAFQPDSPEGMELIAHELTHTIQQQEVVQREVHVAQRSEPQVQRGIVSEALDWIADKANVIPGYRLFTIVIGRNPINMAKVERSGANILRALIEFIPGGGLIVQALENHGIFEKGGKFIEEQFAALGDLGAAMRDALMEFIDSLGWRDIFRLGSLWDRAKRIFTVPVDKAINFGRNLVSGIAQIVKDAIIKPLGRWAAANIPKWDLLVGVFGKNPISDEGESPASALIGGFMELIGQKEIWENIKKGNAVAKAWAWFQGAMKGALALVTSIPGRVMSTIRSLTIFDIVTLVGAFRKIFGAFASFVGDFIRWAGGTVLQLLEIILSVVAPTVVPYLKKAGGAFSSIIKNPIGFVRTLVRAGIQGFRQFATNFLTHLKASLIGWLTGALGGAGIYIPTGFTLIEILKFVLSVMGLTWANVRAKLVAATNETVVTALETGFDIVKTLVTEGPAAAWQKIVETLTNLKQMAIDAVMDFVKSKVIEAAVTKLLSMLNPAGAFIQAIIAIYNTIMFFVERIRQIAQVAAAFIDGIAAIAAGNIAPAANKVEQTMAGLLTLVISFLARIAGLGKVSDAVLGLVKKIRDPIDKALDKVVAWIVETAKKLGKMLAKGAKSLLNWWKEKRRPTLGDGATHTLGFEGSAKSATLMLASKKAPVEQHLTKASSDANLSGAARGRAAKALDFYTKNLAPISGKTLPEPPPPAIITLLDNLPTNLNAFTDLLIAIADKGIAPPPSKESFTGPGSASIESLSNVTSRGGQDARSGMPGGWAAIVKRGLTSRNGNWVRMHMISAGFGGLDIAGNLVPTPTAVNTGGSVRGFERAVEQVFYGDKSAKDVRSGDTPFSAVANRKAVMWVKTTTSGFWPEATEIDPDTNKPLYDGKSFVKTVSLSAGMYFPKDGGWVKDTAIVAQGGSGVPKPDFTGTYVPNINTIGRPLLIKLAGITEHYARDVVDRGPHGGVIEFRKNMAAGRALPLSADVIAAMNQVIAAVGAKKLKWRD